MYPNPENIFPSNVSVIQMSHSDFSVLEIDYDAEVAQGKHKKLYDFMYVMTNTENEVKKNCTGWGAYAKNWPLAKKGMDIMCSEMNFTGVVLGIVDSNGNSCEIPPSCQDKVFTAQYVNYFEAMNFMRQSKFLFLPQVYDASPRVAVEAMSLNVPLLMNNKIVGGWKYINEQTGEFFNDNMSDFRMSVAKLVSKLDSYAPRSYVELNYGKQKAGNKLRAFVEDNFSNRVNLPKNCQLLIPSEPTKATSPKINAHDTVGNPSKGKTSTKIKSSSPRLFTVFSTKCSPYQDWQAQTLIHNHKKQGIQGFLVRLLACDDPNYVLPKHSYEKYRVVRMPDFGLRGEDNWR